MSAARLFSIVGSLKIGPDAILKDRSWLVPRSQTQIKNILILYLSTNNSPLASKSENAIGIEKNKDGNVIKKKQLTPKILVIDEHGSKKFLYLEEAEKIAKHKHLKLMQEDDKNYKKRTVYRMIPSFDFESEERESENDKLQPKELKKKFKKFTVRTEATTHDLNFKIKHIKEVLDKGFGILLEISTTGSETGKLDDILNKFQEELCLKEKVHERLDKKKSTVIKIHPKNTE